MYKAILNIRLEIHETNAAGECTGNVIDKDELLNDGIKTAFLIDINGNTKNECITKLKTLLKDISK